MLVSVLLAFIEVLWLNFEAIRNRSIFSEFFYTSSEKLMRLCFTSSDGPTKVVQLQSFTRFTMGKNRKMEDVHAESRYYLNGFILTHSVYIWEFLFHDQYVQNYFQHETIKFWIVIVSVNCKISQIGFEIKLGGKMILWNEKYKICTLC